MNIKSLLGLNTIQQGAPTSQVAQAQVEKAIKSESATDRDANGQYFSQQRKKKKMTQEQVELALKKLQEKSFMTEMNWQAELSIEGEYFYLLVKDQTDQLIKKISEYDLWELIDTSSSMAEPKKGNLLNKSA